MNMHRFMFAAALMCVLGTNGTAQEKKGGFVPSVFWESGVDRGIMLVSPMEMIIVDSKGNKHGKILATEDVYSAHLSPDGKKLAYTTAIGVRLAQVDTGQSYLVMNGYCDYLRWSADSMSFLFSVGEYKKDEIPVIFTFKFFWADSDGKSLKQVYP